MGSASVIWYKECVQTLMNLGLTLLQAKTYIALAKLEKAEVKAIAKASNVARQDIYRIMPTLQQLGLAEQIITKPTMYKATPIKEGLSILLQNRKKEYAKLQKKTTLLINSFHANNAKIALQEENTQFIITSEPTLFLKTQKRLTQKAQTSIDIIIPLIAIPWKLGEVFSYVEGPLKRGVKIRLLTQEVAGGSTPRKLQALAKNPFFELKYLVTPFHFGMHIYDKKEVTLSISEKSGLPSLWSNNTNILELATSYFEDLWNKAHAQILTQHTTNLTKSSSCIGSVSKST